MSFLSKVKAMFGGAGVDASVDPSKSCDCGHEHGHDAGADVSMGHEHKCDCGEGECMTDNCCAAGVDVSVDPHQACDCGHDHA